MITEFTQVDRETVEIHLVPKTTADLGIIRTLAGNEEISAVLHFDGTLTIVGEGD